MNLHVVVAGHLLGPPSGANRRLLALLEAVAPLLGTGERVTVLHRAAWTPPPGPAAIAWQPAPLRAQPSCWRAFDECLRLPRVLRQLGADVFDHGCLPLPPAPCPVLLTIHDLRDLDGHGRWPRWLAKRLLARACQRAGAVVAPSEFTAARLRTVVPDLHVRVIPNGVALPAAAPAAAAGSGAGYLLHVGHLERRKNLDLLLAALADLSPASRPRLVLAGADAGDGGRLRAISAQLAIDVEWRGVVAEAELPGLYAGARAVAVPSRYEGFGLCALEGLAHGRPVLVADAGALPEVVGAAGVVLPARDAGAWARAIAATDREQPGAAALRRARAAQFAWRPAAERLLQAWRALASGGARDG